MLSSWLTITLVGIESPWLFVVVLAGLSFLLLLVVEAAPLVPAASPLSTPLGAKLFVSSAVPAGTIIGLDKRYALEMVSAGGVNVEYDKLIDCQLERAAVTSIAGFSKIFADAVKVLSNPEETEDQGE